MSRSFDALTKVRDGGNPIAALTAYDYPTGRLVDEAGADIILVGDSLGMVVLGYEDTTHVTLAEMLHHTRAVRRGVSSALVVADLPYRTYDTPRDALHAADQMMALGVDAVKLEGGLAIKAQIEILIEHDIPVVGHLGMLPQQIQEEGRYTKKGKTEAEAARLLEDAQFLDQLGLKAVVLESMFKRVARKITSEISIPTIGIGSGKGCDGQILVLHDLIGAFPWFCPPFAIPKANVAGEITRSVKSYMEDVRDGQ